MSLFMVQTTSIKADMPIGVSHRQLNQYPIGSRNSAIHNDYHSSLRPSSFYEPKHPSLIHCLSKEMSQSGSFGSSADLRKRTAPPPAKPAHTHTHSAQAFFLKYVQLKFMRQSMQMILPQVHLRKPCYDFSFL